MRVLSICVTAAELSDEILRVNTPPSVVTVTALAGTLRYEASHAAACAAIVGPGDGDGDGSGDGEGDASGDGDGEASGDGDGEIVM